MTSGLLGESILSAVSSTRLRALSSKTRSLSVRVRSARPPSLCFGSFLFAPFALRDKDLSVYLLHVGFLESPGLVHNDLTSSAHPTSSNLLSGPTRPGTTPKRLALPNSVTDVRQSLNATLSPPIVPLVILPLTSRPPPPERRIATALQRSASKPQPRTRAPVHTHLAPHSSDHVR
jgi:hypothetical protein